MLILKQLIGDAGRVRCVLHMPGPSNWKQFAGVPLIGNETTFWRHLFCLALFLNMGNIHMHVMTYFCSSMQPRIWIFVQNFVSEISCIYFGTVFPVLQTYCLFKKPGWQANDGYVLVLFWSVNSHVLILHDSLIVSVSYILWKQSIWLVVEILRFLISLESVRRGGLCRWERKLS